MPKSGSEAKDLEFNINQTRESEEGDEDLHKRCEETIFNEDQYKNPNEEEVKVKKKVNIITEEPNETTALKKDSEASDSLADRSVISNGLEKCLTMTGTVKRGKKAGQNLDVRLKISREELEMLDANIAAKTQQSCFTCGLMAGPHVFLWTLLCFPVAVIVSSVYSFYMGTMMWYNVFTYVTEEAGIIWRILLSPFLILFYPLFILICSLGLGFYAGIIQISWFYDNWIKKITDLEKGFYGWLCSIVHLEDCSPYEVIILSDIKIPFNTASQDTLAN
ncbi:transmembrane protein 169 isoform X2 [Macrosteles quadrilineatus]|nr:transmembrane protein 169 isoform X2 [Macrosteles quadrilineatus]XP_054259014.1 transmembrane protein 169 isoform X2 [Macrosteles quadrilineatus]